MEQGVGLFVEQTLAVVLGREMANEPIGQACRCPTIKMQSRLLGQVMANAVPVERRLAAYVQTFHFSLQED